MADKILEIRNLTVQYAADHAVVEAVNGINLSVERGESLGLVGETGAGKTTTALSIMQLLPDVGAKITSGNILYNGESVLSMSVAKKREYRGNKVSMIFQDPMTALNPILTVGDQIMEVIRLHTKLTKEQAGQRAVEMLEMVGISGGRFGDYPHQFSGGMKQRVVIAIALACNPQLLIADEPTTALDVTIQAQVLELMKQLIREKEMSMLLITHDLGVVAEVCEDVAVMYAGRIVEKGTADDVFNHMKHPYTEGLFDSLPNLKERGEELVPIRGLMPDPSDLPPGCAFSPRCPYATEACSAAVPGLRSVEGSSTHFVACSAYDNPEFSLRRNRDGK